MGSRLGDLALGVLAVLTAVLVGVVVAEHSDLTPNRDDAPSSAAREETPSGDSEDDAADDAAETDTPTDAEDATTDDDPATEDGEDSPARIADGRVGLLAHAPTGGTCRPDAAPAELVVVRDGRETTVTVPDLTLVTGIQVVDQQTVRVIGGDAECALAAMTSADRGETWQAVEAPGFWSLVPGDETGLVHASGSTGAPCTVVSVSGVDLGVARVLCDDGRVLGTADAGTEWVGLGELADAHAISFSSPAVGYAVVEDEDCDGAAVVRTASGGASWEQLACVELEGPWGISANDSLLLVAGADGHRRSTDAGESWS